jgi:hypothetical protein
MLMNLALDHGKGEGPGGGQGVKQERGQEN